MSATTHETARPTAEPRSAVPPELDVRVLERELREKIRGEVRFDRGARALYATDGSNYREAPIGVVLPRSREDIIATVAVCRRHGAPLLSRGGGTSLAGQCCNIAVVMDLSKYYHRILEIDPEKRLIRVEPGIVLDEVQKAAAEHDLIFGPNPATHTHCTIGGMVGNNSCGINSLLSAVHGLGLRTSDNLAALEVLAYDGTILRVGAATEPELADLARMPGRPGEIYSGLAALRDEFSGLIRERFPKIPRRVSGYNLDDLLPEHCNIARSLSGTEGTCVVMLEATLHLVPRPKARAVVVLGYPDAFAAGDHVPEILRFRPIGLEGIDDYLVSNMRDHGIHLDALPLLPPGGGWLLVEFGGDTKEQCRAQANRVIDFVRRQENAPALKLYDEPRDMAKIWEAREAGLGATAFVTGKPDTWEGWEDASVAPDRVGPYLRDFRALLDRYDYHTTLYGHYGQGCIHCRINFDLVTADGIRKWRAFLEEASDLIVHYGGSFTGEHGDGQSKAEFLPKIYGPELIEAFRRFKTIWDPDWKMNPGKIVDPNPITSHLRLGTSYHPATPKTFFNFPNDHASFGWAVLRCVGVGECRKHEGGTMCPSYMVTREEMHSTRGRARLLWEMLQGGVLEKGFREEAVKEALDLCLACKGCKGDCPVHVDMATYKAEFLAHYYQGRVRPLHAYAFGLIARWARLGAALPRVANFFQRTPPFRGALKAIIGIAPQRTIPSFAPETFRHWFLHRAARPRVDAPPVILWADTFNNYYHPDVARAAVHFLEGAGWNVIVPRRAFCCGRPLFDYGMVDTARRWLAEIVAGLRTQIRAGIPVVVLEPSCAATFRDELGNLFPHDLDAQRLGRQTLLLSEFIEQKMPHHRLPRLERAALLHGHCHHHALMKLTAEERVLERMGVRFETLDSGCCGMAGAFGFEKAHYEISIACGERVLLPRVRAVADDTLIIANGFSCHEQIRQTTSRAPLHLAQVLELAHRAASGEDSAPFPERGTARQRL